MQTILNQKENDYLHEQVNKELARTYFKHYVKRVHHGVFEHHPHTDLLCEAVQPIADGETRNIIIEMPPRHGKSMTITETFPSFFIGKNPGKRVITAAYSDSLARKFGRLNRNKLAEFGGGLFGVNVAYEKSAGGNWDIEGTRGGMVSTGIGGSITGEGADLLIIDDPVKNREEANSITMRDKVWNEWLSTLSTRKHKDASVILIMTRWHEDDLVGRMLEKSPLKWERVRLPAIAEDKDDLLGREIGEALAPGLGYDEAWAASKKEEVGSQAFAGLYQQRPSPLGGNIFNRNWWQYYDVLPERLNEVIQTWDLAFKDNKDSDYVVGQVWGRKGADKYLIDQFRARVDFPGTLQAIRTFTKKHPRAKLKLIEDKANGPAVIATLKREIPGIVPINPQGGKVVRAQAITPDIEAGNVYLPKNADFTHDFVEEAAAFPNGANDDQVDAATQGLNRLQKGRAVGVSRTNIW